MIQSSNRKLLFGKVTILVLTTIVALYAFSTGPPPAHTGGFGEPTCQECHGFAVGDGSFSISGVPSQYIPGQVYPITVQISQRGQARWGFQLAARFQSNAAQAGNLQVTDPVNTQIIGFRGIQYIEHTLIGTRAGIMDGPVSWQFNWVAPATPGPVQFNAAGNAADNDGTPSGDFIYTAQMISSPSAPTFCISGRVSAQDGTAISGVSIRAAGPSSAEDRTGLDGRYRICNLAAGTYSVSASRTGFVFDPPFRGVTLPPDQSDINFMAIITPSNCILGRVTLQDGSGLSEVSVTTSGPSSDQASTDSNGHYRICNLINGTYAVTPSRAGYSFDPPSRVVTVPPDQSEINFMALIIVPTIWRDWEMRGGGIFSAPAAASWGIDRLDVFAKGFDSALYHTWWDAVRWNGWQYLAGYLTAGPGVAATYGFSRLSVFVRGLDNRLYLTEWDGFNWSDWENLGGLLTSEPAAVSIAPDRLDVFVSGADNALWHKWRNGTAWSEWETLGGILSSAPAVAPYGTNQLIVFCRGADNTLWTKSSSGTTWSGWESLGGVLTSAPAAAAWGTNRLSVFCRGADNALWHKSWNGTNWGPWEFLGGRLASAPAATSRGPNSLDVFVQGLDNSLWQKSWDNNR